MPLITIDDVLPTLGGLEIDSETTPSEDDVTVFIAEIESEVRAMWVAAGCDWPLPDADAATFPKLTELLGVKWRVMDARYSLASASMAPDALQQARLAYNDRLNRLRTVCVGAGEAEGTVSSSPRVGRRVPEPISGSSFGEWTERRDRSLRRPVRPGIDWGGFGGW